MASGKQAKANGGATLGFEEKLWQMADALRNNMDAAEYKHVVLGLIFLKYISDAFEVQHEKLEAERGENVRAHLRVIVKRILRKYGYPPDLQEKATETVLEQAALLSSEWAVA